MYRDLKQNFGFADYRIRKLDAIKVGIFLSSIIYAVISIVRFDILLKFLEKTKQRIFDRIKRYFTLGKMVKSVGSSELEQLAEAFILSTGVRFMVPKNAKL